MTRAFLWITLVLATLVVVGIVLQVYFIAAYVFGAGQDALDVHEGFGNAVHGIEVLTFLATIGAFWRRWWDIGLGFALALIYLVLAAQFGSFRDPLIVLLGSVPLAISGALVFTFLDWTTINIYSQVGLITLVGLVAKNGILIVEFANQLRDEGRSVAQAIVESSTVRLRPILMTTIAMVIGMLPIALASGAGAEWKNGLAWVIIGGLLSSLFLTLVVVPVIYAIFDKLINKFSKKKPQPIDELMVAKFKPVEIREHEFDPSHI